MRYDDIGVKTQQINGVKNPSLNVIFTTKNQKFDLDVKEDGKSIKYECISLNGKKDFLLKSELSTKSKKIEVYIIVNKKKIKIVSLKNNILLRLKRKILTILKSVLSKIKAFFYILGKGIRFAWKQYHFLIPISMWKKYIKDFIKALKNSNNLFYNPFQINDYNNWLNENKNQVEIEKLEYNPLISILIPVYNINKKYLSECLDSILSQSYENFEVCLVDDCSTLKETKETLDYYAKKDKRIKVKKRKTNGHISKATNDALKMANGEFICLVDDDDLLDSNALYEMVKVLNDNKKIDMIYSDEDKLDINGRYCDPHFKPDFSPDTLLSLNYICHLTIIRKSIVIEVGGFEVGLEGAQDHDLFLKVTEKTNKIYHVPKILYHWRMVPGSTSMTISNKSYATDKGAIAIENALKRRKILGHVEKDKVSTYYRVVYDYKREPLVSIIIPTRDYVDTLRTCVDSIYNKTIYKNFEIIVANNDSKEKQTLEFFKEYQKKHDNFKVVDCIMEFNYSRINNEAIKKSKGKYIVLLNNDTEVITPNWLNIMVGYAMQKHIGTVGVKLLYPDTSVQHAGVIAGLGGVASHVYIGSSRDDLGMYGRLRVPYDYSANTAACIMVDKKKFDEVGGLEEELKVAYNDIDFNFKLLKKGYYNVFLPQVELFHFESKSRGLDTTSEKYKRFLIESDYMYKKWDKEIKEDRFYNPNFSKKGWFMLDKKGKRKK